MNLNVKVVSLSVISALAVIGCSKQEPPPPPPAVAPPPPPPLVIKLGHASPLTGPQARFDVKRELNSRLPAMDYGLFFRAIERPEMREGMDAFLQKRPPEWPRS